MLKNNLFLKVIFLSFLFLASSCSTIKQPAEVFTIPDFNEKDVKENEIRRISELSEKYPVKALWRSLILNDEKTISYLTGINTGTSGISAYYIGSISRHRFHAMRPGLQPDERMWRRY